MQGTTSVIIRNSYRRTIWFLCGQKGAADLQRPSNGIIMHARSGIGWTLSPSGCVHSSSWAVICAVFAGHPRRIASHRVPQKLHYKRVRSESLLDLIHVSIIIIIIIIIIIFVFLCLVWTVYIAVEVQFYICFCFIILCFRYVLHGNKLKVKNKS